MPPNKRKKRKKRQYFTSPTPDTYVESMAEELKRQIERANTIATVSLMVSAAFALLLLAALGVFS